MKNQYFADTRDLFKYDLVMRIVSANPQVKQFTFIPMLTRNRQGDGGEETDYSTAKAGTNNLELITFLKDCLRNNRRDITELENFFANSLEGIRFTIYKQDLFFTCAERTRYFDEINEKLLRSALILVDPDTGLEPGNNTADEKYLRYREVKLLYETMDRKSMILIFQFIPRKERLSYFASISKRLRAEIAQSVNVYYVSDNEVVFFILTKEENERLKGALSLYAKDSSLIVGLEP